MHRKLESEQLLYVQNIIRIFYKITRIYKYKMSIFV